MDWCFEFEKLTQVMDEDVRLAEHRLKSEDSQANRRQLVRTLLTFAEIIFNRFRTITAEMIATKAAVSGTLNFHELYPLMDESVEIQRNGRSRLVPQRIPLLNHIAFTIRAHASHKQLDSKRFFEDNGWNQLQEAVGVRHRLTHPKQVKDLEVTDKDLSVVRGGLAWFRNTLQRFYEVILSNDGDQLSS